VGDEKLIIISVAVRDTNVHSLIDKNIDTSLGFTRRPITLISYRKSNLYRLQTNPAHNIAYFVYPCKV